jgi:ribosomal protein L5
MWHFIARLINLACPRIKDFRGVKDHLLRCRAAPTRSASTSRRVWPRSTWRTSTFTHGMHVNMVFSNSDPEMSRFVLDGSSECRSSREGNRRPG